MTAGTFLEHVCLAFSCHGRHSRRPSPGLCRRSIDERRNGLHPLSLAAEGYWLLPRKPGSHRQEMLCCNPTWHFGGRSRQHTDWKCRDGCWWESRRWRFVYVNDLIYHATSAHDHSVSVFSVVWSTSDHSNRSWTNVARPWFLPRTDPASAKLGIISFIKSLVTLNMSDVRVEVWLRRVGEKWRRLQRLSHCHLLKRHSKRPQSGRTFRLAFGNQLSTQNLRHWIPSSSDKNETNAVVDASSHVTLLPNVNVSPLDMLEIVRCGFSTDAPCSTAICSSGVWNIRPAGHNRPVARLSPARGLILQSKNLFVCLRSLSSYTSITSD